MKGQVVGAQFPVREPAGSWQSCVMSGTSGSTFLEPNCICGPGKAIVWNFLNYIHHITSTLSSALSFAHIHPLSSPNITRS